MQAVIKRINTTVSILSFHESLASIVSIIWENLKKPREKSIRVNAKIKKRIIPENTRASGLFGKRTKLYKYVA